MTAARLLRSASDTATTDSMPSLRQARTIRTAISPRLATSTLEMLISLSLPGSLDRYAGCTRNSTWPNSTSAVFSAQTLTTRPRTPAVTVV